MLCSQCSAAGQPRWGRSRVACSRPARSATIAFAMLSIAVVCATSMGAIVVPGSQPKPVASNEARRQMKNYFAEIAAAPDTSYASDPLVYRRWLLLQPQVRAILDGGDAAIEVAAEKLYEWERARFAAPGMTVEICVAILVCEKSKVMRVLPLLVRYVNALPTSAWYSATLANPADYAVVAITQLGVLSQFGVVGGVGDLCERHLEFIAAAEKAVEKYAEAGAAPESQPCEAATSQRSKIAGD